MSLKMYLERSLKYLPYLPIAYVSTCSIGLGLYSVATFKGNPIINFIQGAGWGAGYSIGMPVSYIHSKMHPLKPLKELGSVKLVEPVKENVKSEEIQNLEKRIKELEKKEPVKLVEPVKENVKSEEKKGLMKIVAYGIRPLPSPGSLDNPIYYRSSQEISDEFYKLEKRIKELESQLDKKD